MYVKTNRVRRDNRTYEYLTLVEAVRDGGKVRHRTIARLGEASRLRDTGELDRIIAALRAHTDATRGDGDDVVRAGDLEAQSAPGFGAIAAVWTLFCRGSVCASTSAGCAAIAPPSRWPTQCS